MIIIHQTLMCVVSFLQWACLDIPATRLQRVTGRTLCWTWTESPLSIPTTEDLTTTSSITITKISTRTSSPVSCDRPEITLPALPDWPQWTLIWWYHLFSPNYGLLSVYKQYVYCSDAPRPTTRPDKLPEIR